MSEMDDEEREHHEYVPPRWERELTKPEKFTGIYLNESAMKTLKYTLSHVTQNDNLTLSEAISLICSDWIRLDNLRIRWENEQADATEPEPSDYERDDGLQPGDSGVAEPADPEDKQCDIKSPHSGHTWDDDETGKSYWCDGVGIKLDYGDPVSTQVAEPKKPGPEPKARMGFQLPE